MCFENLPIEFDEHGNAFLKDGVKNPYSYVTRTLEEREDKLRELAVKNGQLADIDFDPVTRVAGALAFHSKVDLDGGEVLETVATKLFCAAATRAMQHLFLPVLAVCVVECIQQHLRYHWKWR